MGIEKRKLEPSLEIYISLPESGWQSAGSIDLMAFEDEDLSRLIRNDGDEGLRKYPVCYYRCSQISQSVVESIQAALKVGAMAFCKIDDGQSALVVKVKEIYQCDDGSPDLKWMITGLHFPTSPIE